MNIIKKRNKNILKIYIEEADCGYAERIATELKQLLPHIKENHNIELKIRDAIDCPTDFFVTICSFLRYTKEIECNVRLDVAIEMTEKLQTCSGLHDYLSEEQLKEGGV